MPSSSPIVTLVSGAAAKTSAKPGMDALGGAGPTAKEGTPGRTPTPSQPAAASSSQGQPTGGPSEELLDAVVDLVQNEPTAMSVLTSGSQFIHGTGGSHKAEASSPTSKLDGTAAELIRPMLRQWLAENMPHIVEEALRSELKSTSDPDKGSGGT